MIKYVMFKKSSGDVVRAVTTTNKNIPEATDEIDVLVVDDYPKVLSMRVVNGIIEITKPSKFLAFDELFNLIPKRVLFIAILKSLFILFNQTSATPPNELVRIKQKYDDLSS